jgi:hypothetical protein
MRLILLMRLLTASVGPLDTKAGTVASGVESAGDVPVAEPVVSEELARRLVEQARIEGLSLIGPGGLLGDLTKKVLESSLEVEMTDHLGMTVMPRRAATGATPATGSGPRR